MKEWRRSGASEEGGATLRSKRWARTGTKAPAKVLALVDYFPPTSGGGPATAVRNLASKLSPEFAFLVATRDRDPGSPQPYQGVRHRQWSRDDAVFVRYLAPFGFVLRLVLLLRTTPHEILYLNSAFSPRFTLIPLLLRWLHAIPRTRLVIAPRGEFSN